MTCATCPNCGTDLRRFDKFQLGHLVIWANVAVYWKDHRVALNPAQRLMVIALARAHGALIPHHVLADVIGYDGDGLRGIVAVTATKARAAFRVIDPHFNAIESDGNAQYARGMRWAASTYIIPELLQATAAQRAVHKLMLEHPRASIVELAALAGTKSHNSVYYSLRALQRRRLVHRLPEYKRGWAAIGSLAMHAEISAPIEKTD